MSLSLKQSDARFGFGHPDHIDGAVKAFAVLESFDFERQRLSASLTAERTGLTRAAARRHLLTLAHLGYLESDGSYYWLAPKVLKLAGSYLSSARLPRASQPTLNRLAQDSDQAFSVAVLDGIETVVVARSGEQRSASRVMPMGIHLGARLPAFATSTGRMLMAGLAIDERSACIARIQPFALTPHTLTNLRAIKLQINRAASNGYCTVHQEHELNLQALAVPIRDAQGKTVAALNVVQTPLKQSPQAFEALYLPALLNASNVIRSLL